MKPDTFERVKARGIRVLSQINLPPGRYQLRVAAGNAARQGRQRPVRPRGARLLQGAAGDERRGVDGARRRAQVVTIKPKDPLGDLLPGPPTTAREFARGDVLALFTEFYENARNAPAHMLDFRAELRADGGRVVQRAVDERSSTELDRGTGGYGFDARLSLADVEPGLYVIHVEGRSRGKARPRP